MITTAAIAGMIGADALDVQDDRIGEINQVYVDEQTDHPTWVSVRLGLMSGAEVLVPLENAEWDERSLHVAVERRVAREAPRKEMDEPLTLEEQDRLYTHYGIPAVQHPRSELGLMQVDQDEICYSVRDDVRGFKQAS
ncbi:PRC-barrel domain-containing protein [uncultured Amnibacterium sp.]|uniref:PRC-barrel domain-containing protein n=1 Tax=uncultured Amnibacterium sp. TaxID=1631851 RepID=UPI0035C9FC1C